MEFLSCSRNECMNYKEFCISTYGYIYKKKYVEYLAGKTTKGAQENSERQAQHEAIVETFTKALGEYKNSYNATEIWNAIYRAHLFRKININNRDDIDEAVVDAIISAAQSWKKSSGHVFEDYVVRSTKNRLKSYNLSFVLQKELTQMLSEDKISNDDTDNIESVAKSDNFDIYAIVNVNGRNIVFGCIQAKTSIRDRVGRDRGFSIPIMERNFWSVAVVLDGTYLAMPKFEQMVNGGGTTQYKENGWHGMYALSNAQDNDRIYADPNLDILIQDACQAAEKFTSARQRFTLSWRALH